MKWQERDDNAPHQVRLVFKLKNRVAAVAVSCTCKLYTKHHDTRAGYEPMAFLEPGEDWHAIYNDPNNHNHSVEVFGDGPDPTVGGKTPA